MKKKVTRPGLTQRETTGPSIAPTDEEEVARLSAAIDEGNLETWLNRVEEWARNELAAAGLQTVYLAPTPGGGQVSVLDLVKDRPHSPEWLAAQTLKFAVRTRYHMESGNAKDAVWNAIHLAQAIRLTDFKLDLEGPLRTGIKVIKGARESGRETRGERARRDEHWRSEAQKIRERNPTWSQDNIVRHILSHEPPRENGKRWSRSTVLRALRKPVKAGE